MIKGFRTLVIKPNTPDILSPYRRRARISTMAKKDDTISFL